MEYIPEFADRKFGRKKYEYLLPELREILEPTNGIIVYQEQIIQIASRVAGFTLAEADDFRRAVGKKKADLIKAQREKFIAGAVKRGHAQRKLEQLFDDIEKFANYGFNKSHSVAYAFVTYQTAFLKTHYPREFMAALLTSEMDDTDKVLKNLNECRQMGIPVDPPDVNQSAVDFVVAGEKILFGLKAIKGIGESAIEAILEARKNIGKFTGLYEFCQHVDLRRVNRKVIEALIKSGAFNSFGAPRAKLFAALEKAIETGQAAQRDRQSGQTSLFGAFQAASGTQAEVYPDVPEWPKNELLQYERECLGFYVTEHPLSSYADALAPYTTHDTRSVLELPDGVEVRLGILAGAVTERRNKQGRLFAKVQAEDEKGFLGVFVNADLYEKYAPILNSKEPLVLCGNTSRDPISDAVEVRAREFIPLSTAREKLSRRFDIRIDTRMADPGVVDKLHAALAKSRGKCQTTIVLVLPDGRNEMVLRLEQRISPSADLIKEIRSLSRGISLAAV
ncbi:MAG: DNA polymerase III subunit alpha, partial [Bdellovibrionota bacterium]